MNLSKRTSYISGGNIPRSKKKKKKKKKKKEHSKKIPDILEMELSCRKVNIFPEMELYSSNKAFS